MNHPVTSDVTSLEVTKKYPLIYICLEIIELDFNPEMKILFSFALLFRREILMKNG